jgi:NAD-reducing hydrogenase large subunit
MCNLIVSTTHNNEPMNQAVTRVAKAFLAGKSDLSEGLLNHIDVAIRAYDPCLSCATHAIGRLALHVQVVAADGRLLREVART